MTSPPAPGNWLYRLAPRSGAVRLFCFHPAGLSAAFFRDWPEALPQDVETFGVQLPGRANRFREAPIANISVLVQHIVAAVTPFLNLPYALFGHSMGAVLAGEVARELASRQLRSPTHLFVSGRRPPHVPDPDPPFSHLTDGEFVVEINRRYGGIPPEILNSPDVLAMLLPCLRADIAALEQFRRDQPGIDPKARLACPISAFGGEYDPQTPREHLEAWRELTTAAFWVRTFPGRHFYLEAQRAAVLDEVSDALRPVIDEIAL